MRGRWRTRTSPPWTGPDQTKPANPGSSGLREPFGSGGNPRFPIDQEVAEPTPGRSQVLDPADGVPERVSSWVSSGTRMSRTGRLV